MNCGYENIMNESSTMVEFRVIVLFKIIVKLIVKVTFLDRSLSLFQYFLGFCSGFKIVLLFIFFELYVLMDDLNESDDLLGWDDLLVEDVGMLLVESFGDIKGIGIEDKIVEHDGVESSLGICLFDLVLHSDYRRVVLHVKTDRLDCALKLTLAH